MNEARFLDEDFAGFLDELVKGKRLNDSKEEGIAKYAIDNGYDALSNKQKHVLQSAIAPYLYEDCSRCGCGIPWCEMSAAEDNGGMCSWCQQMTRHDND